MCPGFGFGFSDRNSHTETTLQVPQLAQQATKREHQEHLQGIARGVAGSSSLFSAPTLHGPGMLPFVFCKTLSP